MCCRLVFFAYQPILESCNAYFHLDLSYIAQVKVAILHLRWLVTRRVFVPFLTQRLPKANQKKQSCAVKLLAEMFHVMIFLSNIDSFNMTGSSYLECTIHQ